METNTSQPEKVILRESKGPGCLIQALWFLFIGWWLGATAISVAWFLNITIIGLPLGMLILNNIPMALALQPATQSTLVTNQNGRISLKASDLPQVNFLLRAFYFLLIGWWWSGIWLSLGYALCATFILLPLGLEVFRLTPMMTTLRRY
jgi:uncharacterized membrane protein YccF (DUF307 family)